jgi:outer membrane immunogenic protein
MYNLSKLAAGSVIAATAAFTSADVALADRYAAPKRVVYERPSDWSGVYFGVQSGYSWSTIDVTQGGATASADHDGGIVGAHLGLQHQFGSVVVGVEGTWISAFRDEVGVTDCPNATFSCEHRFNDVLTVGGRLGWAAGHWMPYVTGGYASARFEAVTRTKATNIVFDTMGTRNDGWFIGGGFEWQVSPGWTAGLEYRHYEFDTEAGVAFTPAGVFSANRTLEPSLDTVTARVSWRWGRPEPAPLK